MHPERYLKMLKSDSQLIYHYITANRPSRFTTGNLVANVKREDGSSIPYGSASAAITSLRKRKLIDVVDTEPSGAGPHIKRFIYGFVGPIEEPRWSGKRTNVRHRKAGKQHTLSYDRAVDRNGVADESNHAKQNGLSADLLSLAAQIEKIAIRVEELENVPSPKIDTIGLEILKRLGIGAR